MPITGFAFHFYDGFNDIHGKAQFYYGWAVRDVTPGPVVPRRGMPLWLRAHLARQASESAAED